MHSLIRMLSDSKKEHIMSLYSDNRYNRVMVFIDYRNVVSTNKSMQEYAKYDFLRLTKILVGNRELVGAYIFDAYRKGDADEDDILRRTLKEHDNLRLEGFRVIARQSLKVTPNGEFIQKEVDVSLACEMLEHALMNHFDVAIVVSGDRDFVPAMKKVQSAGKRVEVASFEGSLDMESKKIADAYHTLEDIPFMELLPSSDDNGGAS